MSKSDDDQKQNVSIIQVMIMAAVCYGLVEAMGAFLFWLSQ